MSQVVTPSVNGFGRRSSWADASVVGGNELSGQKMRSERRVLLEGHNLMLERGTGIATYARGLASALRTAGYATDALVSTNRRLPKDDRALAETILFDGPRSYNLVHTGYIEWRRLVGAPFGLRAGMLDRPGGMVIGRQGALSGFERIHAVPHLLEVERLHFKRRKSRLTIKLEQPCDLFHTTRPAPLQIGGVPNVYTIHDIVPLRLPYTTADDKPYFAAMIRDLAQRADHIVTVSEFSRQDIIAFTGMDPKRITNTYQAVGFPGELTGRSTDDVATALSERHGLTYKDYYLFVGAIEPKKNISRLIDAYGASGVKRPLAIAGGLGWMYDGDLERINGERFLTYSLQGRTVIPHRRVRRLSYLPLQDVVDLIRGARALLYPSIYEGFGLPVAEAMLLGTPVLTSNVASLPEVAGGAAELVDPYDIDAMSRAIRKLDADDDVLADMTARGLVAATRFSPAEFSRKCHDVYATLF